MEKYATYNYYKNIKTGKIKQLALHEELESLEKVANINTWVKITDPKTEKEIENQK